MLPSAELFRHGWEWNSWQSQVFLRPFGDSGPPVREDHGDGGASPHDQGTASYRSEV